MVILCCYLTVNTGEYKMTANDSEARWVLLQVSLENECFTVLDRRSKRRRAYHVPFLKHAVIFEQEVYIFTSNSKIMQLNLLTASRQFLSINQLMDLKEIQQTHVFYGGHHKQLVTASTN